MGFGNSGGGISQAAADARYAPLLAPKVLASTMAAITGISYVDVTGLSFTLEAGTTYTITSGGWTVPNATRGLNIRLGGTATFSAANLIGESFSSNDLIVDAMAQVTTSSVSAGVITSVDSTGTYISFKGTVVCQNAGTLILQAANGLAGAGNSQVTAGMFLKIEKAA